MADGGMFVYKCARDAHEGITRLSDFMSQTVVAMWNLRWQVQGFMAAYQNATQDDIVQRFALGSGVRGNEIKRACVENSWEDQENRFASILLMNNIAIFEDYVESLLEQRSLDQRRTVRARTCNIHLSAGKVICGLTWQWVAPLLNCKASLVQV
jgi:hypothetical protein